jgi:hypothetical protein
MPKTHSRRSASRCFITVLLSASLLMTALGALPASAAPKHRGKSRNGEMT